MATDDTDDGSGWWVPHLVAAFLGFVVGGWLFGRVVRHGDLLDYWLFAAVTCGVVCAAASVWSGSSFLVLCSPSLRARMMGVTAQ